MPEQTPSLGTELQELLLVGVGAVPGALLRWQFGLVLHDRDVVVNVLGSVILGLLLGRYGRPNSKPRIQLLVGIGFCGSLTTFSSWMVNSVDLIHSGQHLAALGLIGMTMGLGLGGAALGFWIGRSVDALLIRPSEPPQ